MVVDEVHTRVLGYMLSVWCTTQNWSEVGGRGLCTCAMELYIVG